jgi:hypothetical protein
MIGCSQLSIVLGTTVCMCILLNKLTTRYHWCKVHELADPCTKERHIILPCLSAQVVLVSFSFSSHLEAGAGGILSNKQLLVTTGQRVRFLQRQVHGYRSPSTYMNRTNNGLKRARRQRRGSQVAKHLLSPAESIFISGTGSAGGKAGWFQLIQ